MHVFTEPNDGQGIYNQLLIRGTLDILHRENGKPIDESAVGEWLDEIYAGEVETLWKEEFEKCATEFKHAVLKTLRPFQSSADLKDLFYKAFDGIDVLPNDLLTEYYDLIEQGQKIATRELTVSISWKRYYTLKGKRLIRSDEEADYDVVMAPYSPEVGLDLSQI